MKALKERKQRSYLSVEASMCNDEGTRMVSHLHKVTHQLVGYSLYTHLCKELNILVAIVSKPPTS